MIPSLCWPVRVQDVRGLVGACRVRRQAGLLSLRMVGSCVVLVPEDAGEEACWLRACDLVRRSSVCLMGDVDLVTMDVGAEFVSALRLGLFVRRPLRAWRSSVASRFLRAGRRCVPDCWTGGLVTSDACAELVSSLRIGLSCAGRCARGR